MLPIDPYEDLLHRRQVLCGGGAIVFAAMMASLMGGARPVRAQTIAGKVPEVDRVSVRVVVDNYQFAVAAGKKVGSVDVQHFGWGLSADKPPGRTLISEFGLSMHAESKRRLASAWPSLSVSRSPRRTSLTASAGPLYGRWPSISTEIAGLIPFHP